MSLRGESEVKKVLEILPARSLLDLYKCREELGEILEEVMEVRLNEPAPSSEHPAIGRPRKKRAASRRNGRKKGRKRRARKTRSK